MEFETKCLILSDLWINYKNDEALEDFVEYNDLGLPLAYFINTELVKPNEEAFPYIDETYDLLVESLGLDENEEFSSLAEMLDKSEE
jgi:hypothetical protein